MKCGGCGRTFGFRTNQRAGRCSKDQVFECYHCTTLLKKCVFCGKRVSDPAGFVLYLGVFMLVLMGPLLGGLMFPQAITNSRLNSAPVTPLANLVPGETVKVFAFVASNESTVIYGYWGSTSNGGNTWKWTAEDFWITEGSVSVFVDVSSLVYVSQPGNPWGSQNGVENYTAGSPIAIYGSTEHTSNGTTIVAQYVASSPTAMGYVGGYLWPLAAGIIAATSVASVVGFFAVRYQRKQHERTVLSRPPALPPPHSKPASPQGFATQYPNTRLSTLVRRSWITTGVTAVFLALAIPAYFVFYYLGIFIGCMGGVFFAMSFVNRYSYGKSPIVVVTDDQGLSIEPLSPLRYVDDRYVPWEAVSNFNVYFGQTLALRTDRGELILHYLPKELVAQLAAELQARGISSSPEPTFHPLVGPTERMVPLRPLVSREWQERNRLSGARLQYAVITMTTATVGVALIFSSIFFAALSPSMGGLILVLGLLASGVSVASAVKLRAIMKQTTPGDESTEVPSVVTSPPSPPEPTPEVAAPSKTLIDSQLPPVPLAAPASSSTGYAPFPRRPEAPPPTPPTPVDVRVAPVRDYWSARPVEMPNVFPRGLLLSGERVLYEVRPTYWGIYGGTTILVVLLMLLFVAPVRQPGYVTNPFFAVIEGLLALALFAMWRAWHGLAFALTNQRVLTVNGRRGTQGREGPLAWVQRVSLEGLTGSVIVFHIAQPLPGSMAVRTRKVRWPGVKGAPAVFAYVQRLVADVSSARVAPPIPPSPS